MEQRLAAEVQRGIWIDEQRLAEAGLHAPLEISVAPGEIRICSVLAEERDDSAAESVPPNPAIGQQETWNVFRSLAREAKRGRLTDPSTHHDTYLYGRDV